MDESDQQGLIRHLFAIVTGLLEDAASLAVDGQGPLTGDASHRLARTVSEVISQASTITQAICNLPKGDYGGSPSD